MSVSSIRAPGSMHHLPKLQVPIQLGYAVSLHCVDEFQFNLHHLPASHHIHDIVHIIHCSQCRGSRITRLRQIISIKVKVRHGNVPGARRMCREQGDSSIVRGICGDNECISPEEFISERDVTSGLPRYRFNRRLKRILGDSAKHVGYRMEKFEQRSPAEQLRGSSCITRQSKDFSTSVLAI